MRIISTIVALLRSEDLNFLLTNRIPRIALTILFGKISRIRSPIFARASIAIWQRCSDLDLTDSLKQSFESIQDCFTRELKAGARHFDPDTSVFASPCDAIVGEVGPIREGHVFQAKGLPYSVAELLGPTHGNADLMGGSYATLRLTASMYHRFHSPHDGTVEHVTYISGDTWNVNPIALARVERLFCRNERAVLRTRLSAAGVTFYLVPVAAVLVASIRLHFLDVLLHLRYRGPNEIPCASKLTKGQEMGWFQHGSTIIVIAPRGVRLAESALKGARIRAGDPLFRLDFERHFIS
jgi:phosphatidylserine decarboxylase